MTRIKQDTEGDLRMTEKKMQGNYLSNVRWRRFFMHLKPSRMLWRGWFC